MSNITNQNWDGVAPPAFPVGWTADASIVTSTERPYSGSNGIKCPTNTTGNVFWGTQQDGNSGNVIVSTRFNYEGAVSGCFVQLIARASATTNWASTTAMRANLYIGSGGGNGLQILRRVSGTDTVLTGTPIVTNNLRAGTWYRAYFYCNGSNFSLVLQRDVDGWYYNSAGNWQNGFVACTSVTDATISGQGYSGYRLSVTSDSTAMYVDDFSLDTYAAGPPVPATPTATGDTAKVALASSAASGGTSPYTYQWYRSTTAGFTLNGMSLLSGATSLTHNDTTAVAGTLYYYVLRVTDMAGLTADSIQVPGMRKVALSIGFIGDSITALLPSGGQKPPQEMADALLRQDPSLSITVTNQGQSGSTTTDWLPGASSGYLTAAKVAFAAASVTDVHIMLGTNNALHTNLTSAAQYLADMTAIVNDLHTAGYRVILSAPPYTVPGSGAQRTWTKGALELLKSYATQLDTLVNGTTTLRGDRRAYNYFALNTSQFSDGIHPTAAGAVTFGNMWASGYLASTSPGGGGDGGATLAHRSRIGVGL